MDDIKISFQKIKRIKTLVQTIRPFSRDTDMGFVIKYELGL